MAVERRDMFGKRNRPRGAWRARTGVVALLTLGAGTGCTQALVRPEGVPGPVSRSPGADPVGLADRDSGLIRTGMWTAALIGDRSLGNTEPVGLDASKETVAKTATSTGLYANREQFQPERHYAATVWNGWKVPPAKPESPPRELAVKPREATAAVRDIPAIPSVSTPATGDSSPLGKALLAASRESKIALPRTLDAGHSTGDDGLLAASRATKIAPPLRRQSVPGAPSDPSGATDAVLAASRATKIAPPLRRNSTTIASAPPPPLVPAESEGGTPSAPSSADVTTVKVEPTRETPAPLALEPPMAVEGPSATVETRAEAPEESTPVEVAQESSPVEKPGPVPKPEPKPEPAEAASVAVVKSKDEPTVVEGPVAGGPPMEPDPEGEIPVDPFEDLKPLELPPIASESGIESPVLAEESIASGPPLDSTPGPVDAPEDPSTPLAVPPILALESREEPVIVAESPVAGAPPETEQQESSTVAELPPPIALTETPAELPPPIALTETPEVESTAAVDALAEASKSTGIALPGASPADPAEIASATPKIDLPAIPELATAGPSLDEADATLLEASKASHLPLPIPADLRLDQPEIAIASDSSSEPPLPEVPTEVDPLKAASQATNIPLPIPLTELDPLEAASRVTNIPLPMPPTDLDPVAAASETTDIPLPTSPADLDPLEVASQETKIPLPIAPEDLDPLDAASRATHIPLPLSESQRAEIDSFDAALEEASTATRIPLPRR